MTCAVEGREEQRKNKCCLDKPPRTVYNPTMQQRRCGYPISIASFLYNATVRTDTITGKGLASW
ncbi:MAG: hypothetical protein RR367_08300 [Clostridia bacterium]